MSAFTLFIKERLPFFAALWTDQRSARYFRRRYGALNRDARQRLFGTGSAVVLTGPFRGLGYPTESGWGSLVPKWLGTYECELAAIVTDVVRQRPALIVDIGSAEGYYAAGLARLLPGTPVHAFDTSPRARRALRAMRSQNGCANLEVHGACRPTDLQRMLANQHPAFLLCDIEGGELELLDVAAAPVLARTQLLIECHRIGELTPAAVADLLAARFSATHRQVRVAARERDPKTDSTGLPPAIIADPEWLRTAMDEGRGEPQCWLWLVPPATGTA